MDFQVWDRWPSGAGSVVGRGKLPLQAVLDAYGGGDGGATQFDVMLAYDADAPEVGEAAAPPDELRLWSPRLLPSDPQSIYTWRRPFVFRKAGISQEAPAIAVEICYSAEVLPAPSEETDDRHGEVRCNHRPMHLSIPMTKCNILQ